MVLAKAGRPIGTIQTHPVLDEARPGVLGLQRSTRLTTTSRRVLIFLYTFPTWGSISSGMTPKEETQPMFSPKIRTKVPADNSRVRITCLFTVSSIDIPHAATSQFV